MSTHQTLLLFVFLFCSYVSLAKCGNATEVTLEIGHFSVSLNRRIYYVTGINNTLPGPLIEVRTGDTLRATVINRDVHDGVSIHWHGFEMKTAPEMDGVVGVTQCPIFPGQNFTYEFVVNEHPGTYWYHSHSGLEADSSRGIYGMLIVRAPFGEEEEHQSLYDEERHMLLSDIYTIPAKERLTWARGSLGKPAGRGELNHISAPHIYDNAMVNGIDGTGESGAKHAVFLVEQNKRYRLRILNAGESFPFLVCIEGHAITVISTDGSDVAPYEVDCVLAHTAERYDVVVSASAPVGSYWIWARSTENFQQYPNSTVLGVWSYYGGNNRTNEQLPTTDPQLTYERILNKRIMNCFDIIPEDRENCIPVTKLQRLTTSKYSTSAPADIDSSHHFQWHFTLAPSYGHFQRIFKRNDTYGVNGLEWDQAEFPHHYDGGGNQFHQWGNPTKPTLMFGLDGDHMHPHSGPLIIDLKHQESTMFVMYHWDHATRFSHPIHIHGHKFWILGLGYGNNESCSNLKCAHNWPGENVSRYSHETTPEVAPLKDTFVLPAGGWAILRLVADNPGHWFAHCHLDVHREDGMAFLLNEAPELRDIYERWDPNFVNKTLSPSFPLQCKASNESAHDILEPACGCMWDPDSTFNTSTVSDFRCSRLHLCRHTIGPLEGRLGSQGDNTVRGNCYDVVGVWVSLVVAHLIIFAIMFGCYRISILQVIGDVDSHEGDKSVNRKQSKITFDSSELVADTGFYNTPYSISWHQINVSTVDGKNLLRDVSGTSLPGTVTCILGSSGSGKSVLLDILSGSAMRGPTLWMSGVVNFNEEPVTQRQNPCVIKILKSNYHLPGHLTVKELIYYQAYLERPDFLPVTELGNRINMILKQLGLANTINRPVKFLSVGQNLRVKIALFLLFPPSILLLDEPMSGLDSVTAAKVYRLLELVCKKMNVNVILTLHMPTPEIYKMMGHILVIDKGKMVYFGSVPKLNQNLAYYNIAASDVVNSLIQIADGSVEGKKSFRNILENLKVSTAMNVEGQRLASASKTNIVAAKKAKDRRKQLMKEEGRGRQRVHSTLLQETGDSATDLAASSQASVLSSPSIDFTVKPPAHESDPVPESEEFSKVGHCLTSLPRAPFQRQLGVLFLYGIKSRILDVWSWYRLLDRAFLAVMVGLIWLRAGLDSTTRGINEQIGLLFYVMTAWIFTPMYPAIIKTQQSIAQLEKDFVCRSYNLSYYFLVQFVLDIVFNFFWSFSFALIAWSMAYMGGADAVSSNLEKSFIIALCCCCHAAMGNLMGSFFSLPLAVAFSTLCAQLSLILAGFYRTLPSGVFWLSYLSIPKYTYRALLSSEFSSKDISLCHPSRSDTLLGPNQCYIETLPAFEDFRLRKISPIESPYDYSVWESIWPLFLFYTVFQLLSFFIQWWELRKIVLLHDKPPPLNNTSKRAVVGQLGIIHQIQFFLYHWCCCGSKEETVEQSVFQQQGRGLAPGRGERPKPSQNVQSPVVSTGSSRSFIDSGSYNSAS